MDTQDLVLWEGRPVGLVQSWNTTCNPFQRRRTYEQLARLPPAERIVAMLQKDTRNQILSEVPPDQTNVERFLSSSWHRMWKLMRDKDIYAPDPERSFAALAKKKTSIAEVLAYDHLCSAGGTGVIYMPFSISASV